MIQSAGLLCRREHGAGGGSVVAVFVGVRRGTMSYRGACVCGCMLNRSSVSSDLHPTRLHRAAQAGDDSLFQMFTQNHITKRSLFVLHGDPSGGGKHHGLGS